MRVSSVFLLALSAQLLGAPKVANPSFEAKRFAKWPGYVGANGGVIPGWQHSGKEGVNPVFEPREGKPPRVRHAFSDNGRITHGRQVGFIQNTGRISQKVPGFEKGKTYRVLFLENARDNHAPERNPKLKVTLGGKLIVSEHAVKPVDGFETRRIPYARVESATFTAPADGAFELVFEATFGDRVAVLLDHVRIEEVKQP
ncbi:MAG: hypothetical protein HN849_29760 [Victivallales bacterium]|jgi:hypothetical protein|nr:hypothetical protein [Victivallales bacterium]